MKYTESGKILLEGGTHRSLEKTERPLTVLVAEDDPFVRELIEQVLTQVGHTALVADSGESALALVEKGADHIDLLLTDVVMPRMNGVELALAMRARCPNLAVLFISGYTDNLLPDNTNEIIQGAFLQKPFRPPLLLSRMQEAVAAAEKKSL